MSLRLRLFLGLSGLVAALVLAQWWWVHGLTRDLAAEVDTIAVAVGRSVVTHLTLRECTAGEDCPEEEEIEARLDLVSGVVLPPGERHVFVARVPEAAAADEDGSQAMTWNVERHNVERRVKVVVTPDEEDEHRTFFFQEPRVEPRFLSLGEESEHIPIPNAGFNDKLERFREQLFLGSMALFGLGLLFSALVAQRVSAPLRKLAAAARQVGEGELGTQVQVAGSGEVEQAITAFNQMSSELRTLDRRTRELRARRHLGEIGEIARGLAHTLRNPLNALGLSVEELATQAPAATDALAESARRQIRRIDRSIRSFLVLASQGSAEVSDVALGEIVQDVALEALQDGRGRVRLDVDEASGTPSLRAVEPELRAVVQALLVNAVEASPEGATVTVRLGRATAPRRVVLTIEDQGPGLPAEIRERLFQPHSTTKANGSGMGLFLAHRIATTRYGGRLELEDGAHGGVRAVLELGPRDAAGDEGEDHV